MPELPGDWSRFAEQIRRYVEADDEEALATHLTDHALDVADALERVPELERQVANLEADLHSQDADYWRERAERVEAAARPVAYADVRICALCQPDRYHEHAANCPVMALRAALADVPAEPSATFTGDYADAAAGYEALADEPDEEGE